MRVKSPRPFSMHSLHHLGAVQNRAQSSRWGTKRHSKGTLHLLSSRGISGFMSPRQFDHSSFFWNLYLWKLARLNQKCWLSAQK